MKKRLKTTNTPDEDNDEEEGADEKDDGDQKKGELFKHVKDSKKGDTETLDAATNVSSVQICLTIFVIN